MTNIEITIETLARIERTIRRDPNFAPYLKHFEVVQGILLAVAAEGGLDPKTLN